MKIPNFLDVKFTDENGNLTPVWREILSTLFQQMQGNLSNEGFIIPKLTAAEIDRIDNIKSIGAIIYDKDNNLVKINIKGTFKTVSLT